MILCNVNVYLLFHINVAEIVHSDCLLFQHNNKDYTICFLLRRHTICTYYHSIKLKQCV